MTRAYGRPTGTRMAGRCLAVAAALAAMMWGAAASAQTFFEYTQVGFRLNIEGASPIVIEGVYNVPAGNWMATAIATAVRNANGTDFVRCGIRTSTGAAVFHAASLGGTIGATKVATLAPKLAFAAPAGAEVELVCQHDIQDNAVIYVDPGASLIIRPVPTDLMLVPQ